MKKIKLLSAFIKLMVLTPVFLILLFIQLFLGNDIELEQ